MRGTCCSGEQWQYFGEAPGRLFYSWRDAIGFAPLRVGAFRTSTSHTTCSVPETAHTLNICLERCFQTVASPCRNLESAGDCAHVQTRVQSVATQPHLYYLRRPRQRPPAAELCNTTTRTLPRAPLCLRTANNNHGFRHLSRPGHAQVAHGSLHSEGCE